MAARSIASLTISFGLVAIPVKLYSATQSNGAISFNLLHTCGSRVKQQYVCIREEVVVPRDEMVKGYEFAKDQYVVFEPAELKALEEAGTKAIEITEFVPAASVDPVYFDRAYYLAPDKGGAKPYSLFAEALRKTELSALGRWATRGKQYIVLLRPVEEGLVMQQLLYANEVRTIDELEIPQADVKEAELRLAVQLIEQQTREAFDPTAYKDEVRERIEAAVQQKVEGHEISIAEAPTEAGGAKVIDLMAALRASLEKSAGKEAEPAKPARKAPKRAQAASDKKPRETKPRKRA